MTGEVDSAALVGLLEQLATVQRAFGDECVVVLLAKISCCVQRTGNDTYSLELSSRVADGLFVDCEGLREVLVSDFLEVVLVGNLSAGNKETKR